jgi:hypothetical protein
MGALTCFFGFPLCFFLIVVTQQDALREVPLFLNTPSGVALMGGHSCTALQET